MIPKSVTRDHVLAALERIDRDGVPAGRGSRGYDLAHAGRTYPPKYVVALAAQATSGALLDSESFGGGEETNAFLRGLGFTVVAKGEAAPPARAPSPRESAPKPVTAPSASGTTVKVGRVFLNLGVRMGEFPSAQAEKWPEFHRLSLAQFNQSPTAYRERVVGLIQRAHDAGAEVVALPAGALIVGKKITAESYAVPSVPLVIAGGAQEVGEFAVVMKRGDVTERFDNTRVHWLDAGRFTVLTAISSTIGQLKANRYKQPIRSTHSPPDPHKPALIVDVGHQQYGGRYHFNTLRCVARDASGPGAPAVVVLSSWMWSSRGITCSWCQPDDRVSIRTLTGPDEHDRLDLIDVDLGGHGER